MAETLERKHGLRRARCWKRPGKNSIRKLRERSALGHRRRAHHVHVAERPVGLQVGRQVRGDHPQAALAVPHHQEPAAAAAAGKVHAHARLRPLPRPAAQSAGPGGHAHHAGRRKFRRPTPERARCPRSVPWPSPTAEEFFGELELDATGQTDRRRGAQGDPRPAAVPQERGPGLPHARPHRPDALRRRDAADPAGRADRLRAGGRALHPRRALDRPAPPRQRPPAGNARPAPRPGQHGDRRRARRRHDAGGRPHRRFRARARRPRRAGRGRRARSTEIIAEPESVTGQYLSGKRRIEIPSRGAGPPATRSSSSAAPRTTTSRTSTWRSRWACSSA